MNLKYEIEVRADVFNKKLYSFLDDGSPVELYDAARHLPFAGGKRLRPVLVMLSCEAVSGSKENALPYAVALELMHNFTLVHDDIMDKSHLRRNIPTVHIAYDEATAILAGDLLFAEAFASLREIKDDYLFRELNNILIEGIIEVCEGQKLDMDFEKLPIISEEEYMEMIKKKTSALFRIASEGGALCGRVDEEKRIAFKKYGENLGLAFQIHDDYLDMSSSENVLGKDIGNDIRNGKKTLIAVHALNHATGMEKERLEKLFGRKDATDEEIREVYNLFRDIGSIRYAEETANRYSEKAINSLDVLESSYSKDILEELARYAIKREK
ncbi:MAG: polyprenyl synthetase family protein [Thermoplasmata archaeon]|nr:MAG: polyprenyl synthetase family protein [Thermoplasmata archaeon]